MNEKTIEKIISAAYGDGSIIDKIRVNILIRQNREAMELFTEYRNTAKEVHSGAEEEFPDSSVEKVFEAAGLKKKVRGGVFTDLFSLFAAKPMLASATMFLFAALLITTMFIKNRVPEVVYSDDEIVKAGEQTELVFRAINEAFNNAGALIKENVLKEQVAKPMNESYNKISKIIIEGEIK